jgi:hypothetical protein
VLSRPRGRLRTLPPSRTSTRPSSRQASWSSAVRIYLPSIPLACLAYRSRRGAHHRSRQLQQRGHQASSPVEGCTRPRPVTCAHRRHAAVPRRHEPAAGDSAGALARRTTSSVGASVYNWRLAAERRGEAPPPACLNNDLGHRPQRPGKPASRCGPRGGGRASLIAPLLQDQLLIAIKKADKVCRRANAALQACRA